MPIFIIGVPIALLAYESHRTGLSMTEVLARMTRQAGGDESDVAPPRSEQGETLDFLDQRPIGDTNDDKATIGHVAIYDLDEDGLNDVLVCDVLNRRVTWIRQNPLNVYTEITIGADIGGPAHVEAADIDLDGDLDVLVAAMGVILPNNDPIGKIIVLENDGAQNFTPHVLVEKIARANDIQAGDLDGDGDIDLAIGQFGYDQGEIRWMEQISDWTFENHILLRLSGTINTPICDFDNDGDLDILALVSQEWEEVYCFENDGAGNFATRLLYGVADADYGSSGIGLGDMDADGDQDIVWANGDAFVAVDYRPMPSHGVQWLENLGAMEVAFHRVGDFPGAYDPCSVDLDGDGDLDILAVSGFNYWEREGAQSMMWWENTGGGDFIARDLADAPTHLITCDVGDMNNDGRMDIVAGSMNLYAPFDRIGRVTLWINRWNDQTNRP